MVNLQSDALRKMLTRLQMTAVRDQLDNLLDEAARRELNQRETLSFLCEAEITRKDQRRITMCLSIAKFHFVRTLEDFDCSVINHRLRGRVSNDAVSCLL